MAGHGQQQVMLLVVLLILVVVVAMEGIRPLVAREALEAAEVEAKVVAQETLALLIQ
jgi:hypothetical protein